MMSKAPPWSRRGPEHMQVVSARKHDPDLVCDSCGLGRLRRAVLLGVGGSRQFWICENCAWFAWEEAIKVRYPNANLDRVRWERYGLNGQP